MTESFFSLTLFASAFIPFVTNRTSESASVYDGILRGGEELVRLPFFKVI